VEKSGTDIQATDDNIARFECWITKAKKTHPEYVILVAFTLQQILLYSVSVLLCTYIACLVKYNSEYLLS